MIVHAVLFFRKDISSCLINVICGVNQYENLLFLKMKGDDKKREIRFKQIERTLKIKFIKEIGSRTLYMYKIGNFLLIKHIIKIDRQSVWLEGERECE